MRRVPRQGAEAIVVASCITRGSPVGYPCPHYADMRDGIARAVGPDSRIIEYTH
ncbi:CGGC domain-containing protein [Methanoculleus sp. FWC-SCC1]|uniref:CGGC domain-containing protein n=1 Tax=Methanoculleus frigidifontis TaxID=2584085 RepID=A0ABT8M9K8_9EURY|nr:CGGC domain-containing protein [Methanoculleus sp. FWC-SCC1]